MTTHTQENTSETCPAEMLLKHLSGKWKPQIFKLATEAPLRFNALLRTLEGINKQSLTTALREMETDGFLIRHTVKLKPLHVEYLLSDKGRQMIPVFEMMEKMLSF